MTTLTLVAERGVGNVLPLCGRVFHRGLIGALLSGGAPAASVLVLDLEFQAFQCYLQFTEMLLQRLKNEQGV